jgi:hypothetical protein
VRCAVRLHDERGLCCAKGGTPANRRTAPRRCPPEERNRATPCLQNVAIDVCALGVRNTLLEQAADRTSGVFCHLQAPFPLLRALMVRMWFGPADGWQVLTLGHPARQQAEMSLAPSLRAKLRPATLEPVNYQATCFCHGQSKSLGLVCSVCLSSQSACAVGPVVGLLWASCGRQAPPPDCTVCMLRDGCWIHAVFCEPVPLCPSCRQVPAMVLRPLAPM